MSLIFLLVKNVTQVFTKCYNSKLKIVENLKNKNNTVKYFFQMVVHLTIEIIKYIELKIWF